MNSYIEIPNTNNSALTIGSFDGVHRGHKSLIQFLIDEAKVKNVCPYLITFSPHPRLILPNYLNFKLLTTDSEKYSLLSKIGLKNIVIQPFDRDFSRMSAFEFAQNLLIKMNPKLIIIGYDHKFGYDRKGSKDTFRKVAKLLDKNIELIEFKEVKEEDFKINSTEIRNNLFEGNISKANILLGRNYSLQGIVVKGNQLGKNIGFPTANLQVDHLRKLIPKNGVYKSKSIIKNVEYHSITNIGNRPTLGNLDTSIETHIFEFNQNIYGENIEIELIEYIRPEKKFDSLSDLKIQIQQDIVDVRKNI